MMFGLKTETIEAIREVLAKYPEVEKAILYGSRAKGNYRPGSDIDLTLIGEKLNLSTLQKIENELDDLLLPYKIDLSLHKQIQNKELLEHIERVGKVFFDRNPATTQNPKNTNHLSEWREVKLGDVAEIIPGFAFKSNDFGNEGEIVVKIKDIVPPIIDLTNADRVNVSKYNKTKLSKYLLKYGDYVIAMTGATIGKVGKLKVDKQAFVNQRVAKVKALDGVCNDFIYYSITTEEFQGFIQNNIDSHSAQENISSNSIGRFPILLPPLPEQQAIAEVLSSLDDKIDLLHRQNKTLEQLAETLFRQWFVEEDQWNGTLGEYIKVQGGYAFKSKDFKENGFAGVIKIRNISMGMIDINNHDCVDESVVKNIDKRFKIKSGDFLIAMTGAEIGKIGIVEKTEKEIWVNQRVGKLEAKVPFGDLIGYLALKSREGQDHIINSCVGSAQENISSKGIEEMSFLSYEADRTNLLGKEIEPLFKKIIFNQSQIRTLTQLRDTLLPKLMSGEVRVSAPLIGMIK